MILHILPHKYHAPLYIGVVSVRDMRQRVTTT